MQPIETSRLLLRVDSYEDYLSAFATLDDAALKTRFGIQTDMDLEAQKAKVSGGLVTYRTSLVYFHLILKETTEVVGSFAYHNWYPRDHRSEIGYDIKTEAHKNKGYMKEAFPFMISYGFESMGLNRMEAFIDPANTASRRLVEGAGFHEEAVMKQRYRPADEFRDGVVYALLASR